MGSCKGRPTGDGFWSLQHSALKKWLKPPACFGCSALSPASGIYYIIIIIVIYIYIYIHTHTHYGHGAMGMKSEAIPRESGRHSV